MGEAAAKRDFHVGERVQSVDGFRATVRYVGKVIGANPEEGWVGLEWDAEGRGKHDGSAKDVRYFQCPPGRGSFVRPDAVLATSISFQDALVHKYASEEAASAEESMSFREAGGKKAAVIVELVGKAKEMKRMARTNKLQEVTLSSALISCAGDRTWIGDNASGITSLELADNLFCSWESVSELTSELPKLLTISLSGNRLEPLLGTPSPNSNICVAFSSLRKLVLNATGVTFRHLEFIKGAVQQLTDLHLASNCISSLDCSDSDACEGSTAHFQGWPSLEFLDLSDNLLTSWERDVQRLDRFPKLQKLILNGNQIEAITAAAHTRSDTNNTFAELTLLAVAQNRISSWESIDVIQGFGKISELRVQGNPVCEQLRPGAVRQLLIAKVPSLKSVNGGEVRARERIEAEKFYVRHVIEENTGKTVPELAKQDAIFAACLQKHGEPVIKSAAAAGSGPAGGLIQVKLKSMAADSSHKAPVSRKIPGSMTVSSIKRMCQLLFGLDMSKQRLFWQSTGVKDAWEAEDMADDLKPLNYYVTEEDIEVLMQEADLATQGREAEMKEQQQKQNEARQQLQLDAMNSVQRSNVYAAKSAAAASSSAIASDAVL